MKIAVGLFVLVVFISISFFIYLVLEEKGTFDKRYEFFFNTYSAASFKIGMPLKYSGFNIGVIDKIYLKDDGNVQMRFSVTEDNRKWITKDSVLMIKKPLIGSAHIILYSAIDNDYLESGSTLTLLLSDDIDDMIEKLQPAVDRMISIINNVDNLTLALSKNDSDLMLILKNAKIFTENLANDDSLLTSLTGSKKSTNDFKNALDSLSLIMKDVQTITNHLDTDIANPSSSAIKELDLILKDVKQKLEALDGTVKSIGAYDKDLDDMKKQISVGVQKSNEIMDKVDLLMQDDSSNEVNLP